MQKEPKRIRIFHQLVEKAKGIDLNVFMSENGQRLFKTFSSTDRLLEFRDDFFLVWEMLKAYAKREYTEVPFRSITAVVGALLYVLMPLDALPDFILGFGLIDDAAVFGYALKLISDDVKRFGAWKELQSLDELNKGDKSLPNDDE